MLFVAMGFDRKGEEWDSHTLVLNIQEVAFISIGTLDSIFLFFTAWLQTRNLPGGNVQ